MCIKDICSVFLTILEAKRLQSFKGVFPDWRTISFKLFTWITIAESNFFANIKEECHLLLYNALMLLLMDHFDHKQFRKGRKVYQPDKEIWR